MNDTVNKIKKNYALILAALIIFIGVFLRWHIFSISNNNFGADPTNRVLIAISWLNNISFRTPHIDWLPLHFYLIGIGLKVFYNPLFIPRFISFIFSILSLILFYKLTDLIFGKKTALLSLCLIIFYPIHIVCSVVSLSEIPALFFLLTSFYFYFKYIAVYKVKPLIISAICLMLAQMLRYEAWIFALFIPFLLIYDMNKKRSHLITFCVITFIFPLVWSLCTKAMLVPRVDHISPIMANLGFLNRIFYWQDKLYSGFGKIIYILSIIGLGYSLKGNKSIKNYAAIFSALLLFFIFGTLAYYIVGNQEYSISYGTLLIPLSVYGLKSITANFKFKRIVIIIFVAYSIYIMLKNIIVPVSNSDVVLVADYLKSHINKNDKVLIEHYRYRSDIILLLSDLTNDNAFIFNRKKSDSLTLEYMDKIKPKFIVFSKDGMLSKNFAYKNIAKEIYSQLIEVLNADSYVVYRRKD